MVKHEMEIRMCSILSRVIECPVPAKNGAEIKFIREAFNGERYVVFACKSCDGYKQWGAPPDILTDNEPVVDSWIKGTL
jgi:hypothetical protein